MNRLIIKEIVFVDCPSMDCESGDDRSDDEAQVDGSSGREELVCTENLLSSSSEENPRRVLTCEYDKSDDKAEVGSSSVVEEHVIAETLLSSSYLNPRRSNVGDASFLCVAAQNKLKTVQGRKATTPVDEAEDCFGERCFMARCRRAKNESQHLRVLSSTVLSTSLHAREPRFDAHRLLETHLQTQAYNLTSGMDFWCCLTV
eukprot:g8224.t1